MSGYTPGPWTYDEQGGTYYVFGPHAAMVADSQDGDEQPLVRIRGVGRGASIEEQRYNARLIAAAPQIAEALQHVYMTGHRRGSVQASGCSGCIKAEAALKAAGVEA